MSGPLDAITIPSTPPPELKARCADFLKRAAETRKAEPVISYWCTLAAAEAALELKDRSGEGTQFLLQLMDTLEAMKAALADNEAVTSAAAGAAYVENFALRVFMNADNMDRAGKYDKTVIRAFLAAAHFFAVLRSCNGGVLLEEIEEKQTYARWKAADLARALREGREPVHGPPVPDEPELGLPSTSALGDPASPPTGAAASPPIASPPAASPPLSSPGLQRPNAPPGLDIPASPCASLSGTWSTMATPGVDGPDDSDSSPGLPSLPQQPVGSPSNTASPPITSPKPTKASSLTSPADSPQLPQESPKKADGKRSAEAAKPRSSSMSRSSSGEKKKKNVRFMGPDGAPLSPASTLEGVDRFAEPSAPPPSEAPTAPSAPPESPPKVPPKPQSPPKAQSPPKPAPPQPGAGLPPLGLSRFGVYAPPPGTPLTAGAGQGAAQGHLPPPLNTTVAVPAPSAPAATGPPRKLSRKEMEAVQKHAKWAISALDYEDTETARAELRKALAMLG